jgi:hypothetical protein
LLAAARPVLAALRPADFVRDLELDARERPEVDARERPLPAWLAFELPRRDRAEAFVLDEPLRLEPRLLLERLLGDFVP